MMRNKTKKDVFTLILCPISPFSSQKISDEKKSLGLYQFKRGTFGLSKNVQKIPRRTLHFLKKEYNLLKREDMVTQNINLIFLPLKTLEQLLTAHHILLAFVGDL